MLEPQGTLFFLLLMVAFGALVIWLVLTKQVVFRVLAACLAFIPAMVFGIAYPLLTALVVMSTGNHYLLDVLAGAGTVVVAVVVLEMAPRSVWRPRAEGRGAEQDSTMSPPAERVGYATQRGNRP